MIVSILSYPFRSRSSLLIVLVTGLTLLLRLTIAKRLLKPWIYSMSLPATKHSRYGDKMTVGTPSDRAAASKHSTLASTYGSPGSRHRLGAKTRSAASLQAVLPPALPIVFHGLSPIFSFLASSFPGVEDVGLNETPDERPNYRIIHGVKYDAYPRNEVPYSMLYDTVTPEK